MIISQCTPQHRHQEWLKFLKTIDRQVPKDLQIHLILDNYATHQHEEVRKCSTNTPGSTSTSPHIVVVLNLSRCSTTTACARIFHSVPTSSPLSIHHSKHRFALTVEGQHVKPETVPIAQGRFTVGGRTWEV